MTRNWFIAFIVLFGCFCPVLNAEIFPIGQGESVFGNTGIYVVEDDESLIEIAREYGVGFNAIANANPRVDAFVPGEDTEVILPTSWIIPDVASQKGIFINLSEMRLYYFFKNKEGSRLATFPIGIGSEGNDTPVGSYKIVEKIVGPSWYPPESIRKEKPELPAVVPPGPENPLGTHAMRLSLRTYLIHGTHRPYGVGRRVSHGCIRLYPEHIPVLFELVPSGTTVTIIKQPVKVGSRNNRVYIEVHNDETSPNFNYTQEAVQLLMKKKLLKKVNTARLYRAIKQKSGFPVDISN